MVFFQKIYKYYGINSYMDSENNLKKLVLKEIFGKNIHKINYFQLLDSMIVEYDSRNEYNVTCCVRMKKPIWNKK